MTVQEVALGPVTALGQSLPAAGAKSRSPAYLFGPVIDFLGLGGASLIALAVLLLLAPSMDSYAGVATWALLAANVINHPHFANSYQIFYGNFRSKAFGANYTPTLRLRYIVAGIVVPMALGIFVVYCIVSGDVKLLAYAGNAMGFFVGWHYVKQGYGMIVVDSVLKKRFFSAVEKKILLINAYSCWIAAWMLVNVALRTVDFWGLQYFAFNIPSPLPQIAAVGAISTSVITLYMLLRKAVGPDKPPLNGTVAYVAALYAWLLFVKFNPFFLLIVPAFHSLQYLLVVWRYKLNRERGESRNGRIGLRLTIFAALGLILGFLGFWGVPITLDSVVPYDTAIFGDSLFLFVFWIFINVHHYFLDNVMWRRENPETGKYLFGKT